MPLVSALRTNSHSFKSPMKSDRSSRKARCRASAFCSEPRGLSLDLSFDQAQLPFLQILRMGGRGLYGVGIEPCTTGVRSRKEARAAGQMIMLPPGDSRDYRLDISFSAAA